MTDHITTQPLTMEQLFLELVEQHRPLISKVCWLYAEGRRDDYDDMWQNVMVNMWQGLPSFRKQSKPSTWIYRLALNTCLTHVRRSTRRRSEEIVMPEIMSDYGDDPEASKPDNLRQMYALIGRLEPEEKALIMMWLDEKPYEEIAEISGLSRNTVATRLRRIKQKLIKMSGS